jgi:hypothetical protein
MTESDRPLLKHGQVTLTAPSDYVDLLEVECDPNRILYVRDIIIEVGTTTVNPVFNVSINGKQYVKEARILGSSATFGFGGHLKLWKHKKPLLIQVKSTAAGTSTITAWATGLEKGVNI